MANINENKEAYQMMKKALGSIENRFREAYNKGYKDGLRDGVSQVTAKLVGKILEEVEADDERADDTGDCNICRFAGCSECDDCINGSEWVRMVDYLEDVDDEQTDCSWK